MLAVARGEDSSTFQIKFSKQAFEQAFTGDVFVAFSESGEPRSRMHRWFGAPPILRFQLENVAPGDVVSLQVEQAAAHFPTDWKTVIGKKWSIQAIARVNTTCPKAGTGEGDVYGNTLTATYTGQDVYDLTLSEVVGGRPFQESERIRLFEFESPALSEFHGSPYVMRAGVMLPMNYRPESKYPVLVSITGFGGSHSEIQNWLRRGSESPLSDCIVVVPDASNLYGHSVFCDSSSIGPWGQALVHELIPALEEQYGGIGAQQRYVTGVSSGGWSSLWLQVNYPDQFAGCWSHVPDPIDFHDFQQINLYEPLPDGTPRNMYVDETGAPRPLARRRGEVMLTYEDFVRRENVTNPGGQIRSFEATFSEPASDGTPQRVFDVTTGEIDHAAAQAWRKYDLSHIMLSKWDELRDQLHGKVHIYAGEVDSFYLEGAVERFQSLAAQAGLLEDMVVEVIPGMGHSRHSKGHQHMLDTIRDRMQPNEN